MTGGFFSRLAQSRFAVLKPLITLALLVFFMFRISLLVSRCAYIDAPFYQIIAALVIGTVYDLAFLSYFLIPFVICLALLPNGFFQSRLNRWIFEALVFIGLYGLYFDLAAEWLFWEEFNARFNFIAVDYLIYTHEVIQNIIESYPLPILLSVILAVSLVNFIVIRTQFGKPLRAADSPVRRLKMAAPFMAFPLLSYAAVNQNWHHISANNFVNEIAEDGPYQFFAAFRNNEIDYRQFYALDQDQALSQLIKQQVSDSHGNAVEPGLYDLKRAVRAAGPERRLNVILVTVESLSADFFRYFGNTEAITPFMDRWFGEGLLFTHFYATGTRTDRGLEALTLSVPPTPGRSIIKRPDNARLFSLGRVFQLKGYDTVFLYGGFGYFDNMNAFFAGNGYRIVDQTDLSASEIHFKNAWGVADEDVYRRALKEADGDYARRKPFFFHIMTTSNHRPFTFPAGKIDLPSGSGREGAVKYTDYALGQLIDAARGKPWFDDTVFVVVADHCAGSARKAELPVENYHIPFFMYSPRYLRPGRIDTLASQIDMAPTLLALLNFNYVSEFFGRDILAMPARKGRALIGNYQKLGLYEDNKLVYLAPQRQIVVVADPVGAPRFEAVEDNRELVRENMAYYQAADFIWSHRLSRYAY